MADPTGINANCTASGKAGKFCDRPSLPDAPFPICLKHAALLMEFLAEFMPSTMEDRLLLNIRRVAQDYQPPAARTDRPYNPTVYYIRVGALVKIGWTSNITQRIKAYPPDSVLLATEPGAGGLEKQRHREFKAHLAAGNEWFYPSPQLMDHIIKMRTAPRAAA